MHVPSLRQLSKRLNYAISSLHEAREAGYFQELPGGGYDLKAVCQGLLDNTSPKTEERRAMLERIAVGEAGEAAEAGEAPQPEFSPQVESAIKASSALCHTAQADEAFIALAMLPRQMAEAFHGIAPLADLIGSEAAFEDSVIKQLKFWFTIIHDPQFTDDDLTASVRAKMQAAAEGAGSEKMDDELVGALAAASKRKQKQRAEVSE